MATCTGVVSEGDCHCSVSYIDGDIEADDNDDDDNTWNGAIGDTDSDDEKDCQGLYGIQHYYTVYLSM